MRSPSPLPGDRVLCLFPRTSSRAFTATVFFQGIDLITVKLPRTTASKVGLNPSATIDLLRDSEGITWTRMRSRAAVDALRAAQALRGFGGGIFWFPR